MKIPVAFAPACFQKFYGEYRDKAFSMLDVGCGNHAVSKAKKWFKNCAYSGVDRDNYNNEVSDYGQMEKFYKVDLRHVEGLDAIPDEAYDVVLMVHVLEHLNNGNAVLNVLVDKVKPGGGFYIEFPSVHSLSLPHMQGTLNFCDDPTHVRVYDVKDVVNVLLEKGFVIVYAGRRRHTLLFWLAPLLILFGVLKNGRITAFGFWDLVHFADCVYATKADFSGGL
jgi:SAM-dependent methyltransferase